MFVAAALVVVIDGELGGHLVGPDRIQLGLEQTASRGVVLEQLVVQLAVAGVARAVTSGRTPTARSPDSSGPSP